MHHHVAYPFGKACAMTPHYTESVEGNVLLALFDHRLTRNVPTIEPDVTIGITIAYRSHDFDQSLVALADALLRYLVINPASTTDAAYEFLRDKVEQVVSEGSDGEPVHRVRLTLGDLEHLFGMDWLANEYVRLGDDWRHPASCAEPGCPA